MEHRLFNTLIIILAAGILACLLVVSLSQLTSKETTLLGIVLTILSFLASWMVSKHFAERSHKHAIEEVKEQYLSNLRTYALNAAEKVNNLSNELGKLSVYLQQEIEEDDDDESVSTEELYMSSFERIESAIHIINTLKSVNDTYLSDWKGVIGEELDEKMLEQQERENELKELVEKIELVLKSKPNEPSTNKNEVQKLSRDINDLRKELNLTLNSVSGTFVRKIRTKKAQKEDVSAICPHCNKELIYKQRPLGSSYKFMNCKYCSSRLCSTWNENSGFLLEEYKLISETYNCPTCDNAITAQLGSFPHSKVTTVCPNCGESSQLTKNIKGASIQKLGKVFDLKSKEEEQKNILIKIDEEILEKLKNTLPAQPWPKDTHKIAASALNISINATKVHMQELIRRGVFKPQIDGVLYEPIKGQTST
jgi:hypothetical protein